MKITLFGATGSLGSQLLQQSLQAGHEVTALVRSPQKLPAQLRERIQVIEGDALLAADVERALPEGTEAILFAIGVDEKTSPADLCTDVTRHILEVMRRRGVPRLVWCGGGSKEGAAVHGRSPVGLLPKWAEARHRARYLAEV